MTATLARDPLRPRGTPTGEEYKRWREREQWKRRQAYLRETERFDQLEREQNERAEACR